MRIRAVAASWARANRREAGHIIDRLLSYGANPGHINKSGKTLLESTRSDTARQQLLDSLHQQARNRGIVLGKGIGLDVYRVTKGGYLDWAATLIREYARTQGLEGIYCLDKYGCCPFGLWAETHQPALLDIIRPYGIEWSAYTAAAWALPGTLHIRDARW